MDIEPRRAASAIVRQVWPDECEIAGETAVAEVTENPERFARPGAGDHIDLMPILEVLKGAIELVAACLSLYSAAREVRKVNPRSDNEPNALLEAKLAQAKRDGKITADQAGELQRLILERA